MKMIQILYGISSTAIALIVFQKQVQVFGINPDDVVLLSGFTALIAALGAILSVLVKAQSGSYKDLQLIVTRLDNENKELRMKIAKLEKKIEEYEKLPKKKRYNSARISTEKTKTKKEKTK